MQRCDGPSPEGQADVAQLEDLLANAAQDRAAIPMFLAALLDTDVLVPGGVDGTTGGTAGEGSRAQFAHLIGSSGEPVQPFYTSEARLQDTLRGVPGFERRFVGMRCRDFFELTRGSALVLNPHSEYGKEFTPTEVSDLLDGATAFKETVVDKETTVLVGAPATTPEGMEDALRTLLGRSSSVERAYLGWKVDPTTNDQSYLLVIVGADAARSEISGDLGQALVYFSQVHPVDVIHSRPGEHHLLTELQPFFERTSRQRRLFRRR
jgi:hypothetical protein